MEKAVNDAVDWAIGNDILSEYLRLHKSEVVGMLLTEYDEKKVWESFKKDVYEEGKTFAEYQCFKNCMNRGMTFADAKALSGVRDEDASIYYDRWKKEKND